MTHAYAGGGGGHVPGLRLRTKLALLRRTARSAVQGFHNSSTRTIKTSRRAGRITSCSRHIEVRGASTGLWHRKLSLRTLYGPVTLRTTIRPGALQVIHMYGVTDHNPTLAAGKLFWLWERRARLIDHRQTTLSRRRAFRIDRREVARLGAFAERIEIAAT